MDLLPPGTLMVFDTAYMTEDTRLNLVAKGQRYIGACSIKSFSEVFNKLEEYVKDVGDWEIAGDDELDEWAMMYYAKEGKEKDAKKRRVMTNSIAWKQTRHENEVPNNEIRRAYHELFGMCDRFNVHLHYFSFPHKSSSWQDDYSDFFFSCTLNNTRCIYYDAILRLRVADGDKPEAAHSFLELLAKALFDNLKKNIPKLR